MTLLMDKFAADMLVCSSALRGYKNTSSFAHNNHANQANVLSVCFLWMFVFSEYMFLFILFEIYFFAI